MVMALVLDLSNIVGGALLAAGLAGDAPGARRARAAVEPFGWWAGVVALVAAGYWFLVHVTSGPHLFHFELVGLAVGVALAWERLTGRPRPGAGAGAAATGPAFLLAVVGVVAVVVGVQGLFTPDG